MLEYHLNQETDLASRPFDVIDRVVGWIDDQVGLAGKRVCDLGCGPGLYAQRFNECGAEVTGVDFSAHSLEYARAQAKQKIRYLEADYLSDNLPDGFDLISLIYCDLCVLSPAQRKILLRRMWQMLDSGGQLVLDVAGMGSFDKKQEMTVLENNLMGGFWAATDYVGVQQSFVYPQQLLSLDRYLIVEPGESWQIFNWFQHFTPKSIEAELMAAGFEIDLMVGDLSGKPLDSNGEYIGVIARKA